MNKEQFLTLEKINKDLAPEKNAIKEEVEKKAVTDLEKALKRNNLYSLEIHYLKKLRDKINENNFLMEDFNGEKTREKINSIFSDLFKVRFYSEYRGLHVEIKESNVYEKDFLPVINISIFIMDYDVYGKLYRANTNFTEYKIQDIETYKIKEQKAKDILHKIKLLYLELDKELAEIDAQTYYKIKDIDDVKKHLHDHNGFNL